MKKFLFYIAAAGFAISMTIHFLSIFNQQLLYKIPYTSLLHVGCFIVFIPLVFEVVKNQQASGNKSLSVQNIFLNGFPAWIKIIAVTIFVYAIVNFAISFLTNYGVSDIKFIMQKRTVTDLERIQYHAARLRSFSGLWLVFYGAALLYYYQSLKQRSTTV